MPSLFDKLPLRDVVLRNRIGVSPMCQYSAEDGLAQEWHLVHLGSRAVGGAGLIIVEATAVEARGRISDGDLGLWNDEQIAPLKRITDFVKQYGAVPAIQLAHAGRKAGTPRPWFREDADAVARSQPWETVAPSPLAFGGLAPRVPKEMTLDDIRTVQQAFADATRRAVEAGFELVELHGAHGYLNHSFCSPLSNQRTDDYGGSFDNRVRFVLETARGMREAWPEGLPMAVRLSCTDWVDGGWTLDESAEFARRLRDLGVDLIDCSSGGSVIGADIPTGPGFQTPFAERIRRDAGIPTAAVGMITSPQQADHIIRTGQADVVLLGRESLRHPYWPVHAAHALNARDQLNYSREYEWAIGR